MSEIILICGLPGSGKTTIAKEYSEKGFLRLNCDDLGIGYDKLFNLFEKSILSSGNILLDNVFYSKEKRKPFVDLCNKLNKKINCVYVNTSFEDCQINVLLRMKEKTGKYFFSNEEASQSRDPGIFPINVLFGFNKKFEPPTNEEGFNEIKIAKFNRNWSSDYVNKALILDYDQNIRDIKQKGDDGRGYPIEKDEIIILPNRKEKILKYKEAGYYLCGISNQSGVHKNILSYDKAKEMFEETNKMLGVDIDYTFCPHASHPISCWCRKPQVGNLVYLIQKYKLDPQKCVFVGDRKTDETCANRLRMPFYYTDTFFGK